MPRTSAKGKARVDVNKKYKKLTDREHVLLRPGMYIGSTAATRRQVILAKEGKLVRSTIDTPEGLERLLLEIIGNAADNVDRSRKHGVEPGTIDVEADTMTVTVTNYGLTFEIQKMEDGTYPQEFNLGSFRSGSNYDESKPRTGAGMNGMGCAITNTMCTYFAVDNVDPEVGKRYRQEWSDNMTVKSKPKITKDAGESYTKITYTADMPRFERECYTEDDLELFRTLTILLSLTSKVPTSFNGEPFDYSNAEDFIEDYFPEVFKSRIHFVTDNLEVLLLDTPNEGMLLSFVNNIITRNHGTHVDSCVETIFKDILNDVNESYLSEVSKARGVEIKGNEQKKYKIYKKDVIPHITMIVNAINVENPDFDSQSKTKLSFPKSIEVDIDTTKLKKIKKWKLLKQFEHLFREKSKKRLASSDGKFIKNVSVEGSYSDANFAGDKTKPYKKTTLVITEGKSAMIAVRSDISNIPNGTDYWGVVPIRGKLINANSPIHKLEDNAEIALIKALGGFREGVDYNIEKNRDTLRYGRLQLALDADSDGKHIGALVLLWIYKFFKSLIDIGYVSLLRTPVIRVTPVRKGPKAHKFYTFVEYDTWAEGADLTKYKSHYYKGLGSSDKREIREERKDPKEVRFFEDDDTEELMECCFGKGLSDTRKEMIRLYDPTFMPTVKGEYSISDFLKYELGEYWRKSLVRSIPGIDGFKRVQRKVIYTAQLLRKELVEDQMKTATFSSEISSRTKYLHGETSIHGAVVHMAREYSGSNNISLIKGCGQFGLRYDLGKDYSSVRYTSVSLYEVFDYIFLPVDDDLTTQLYEEGVVCERQYTLPILPVVLFNGTDGIGAGSCTLIPSYNPEEVCDYFIDILTEGMSPMLLEPWYEGYKGTVEVDRQEKCDKVRVIGTWDLQEDGTLYVDTLPVYTNCAKVEEKLRGLIAEGLITSFNKYDRNDEISFKVEGWPDELVPEKELNLVNKLSLSNLVFIDDEGLPVRHKYVDDYIYDFYQFRLPYYQKRKDKLLTGWEGEYETLNQKMKIIKAVLDGDLVYYRRKIADIKSDMVRLELDYKVFSKIPTTHFSQDKIDTMQLEIDRLRGLIDELTPKEPEDIWLEDLHRFKEAYKEYRRGRNKV